MPGQWTTLSRCGLLLALALVLSSCIDPSMTKDKSKEKATAKASEATEPATAPATAPAAETAAPAAAPAPAAANFPTDNSKIVDKNKALAENPKLVETENHINATDPLSAAAQGFFAIGSQAQLLNLKHAIDLHKAQFDKPPTFKEFDQMLRQNHVQLKGLYRWQVYAYDEKTGEIGILEDREMKKREYEKGGLPLE